MERQKEVTRLIAHELKEQFENNLLYNLKIMTKSGEVEKYLWEVSDRIYNNLRSQGLLKE